MRTLHRIVREDGMETAGKKQQPHVKTGQLAEEEEDYIELPT